MLSNRALSGRTGPLEWGRPLSRNAQILEEELRSPSSNIRRTFYHVPADSSTNPEENPPGSGLTWPLQNEEAQAPPTEHVSSTVDGYHIVDDVETYQPGGGVGSPSGGESSSESDDSLLSDEVEI